MRTLRHLLWIVAIALALALPPGSAAARPGRSTLILGIQQGGRPNEQARRAILAQLSHQGEGLVAPGRELSHRDLLCDRPECLTALSRREGAAAILGGSILQSGRTYEIRLWLYDAKEEQTAEREGACQDCDETQLREVVAEVAGELVAGAEVTCPRCPKCPEVAVVAAVPKDRPVAVRTKAEGGRWRFGRGMAIGASSGLLLVGLTAGIVLSVQHGMPAADNLPNYRTNLLPEAGLSYGVAGAGALGLVLSLALPDRAEVRR